MIRTERLMCVFINYTYTYLHPLGGLDIETVYMSLKIVATCSIKDLCMDYHHCIVPSHKNFSSGLTHFCTILRHDGQHTPFVYTVAIMLQCMLR